MMVDDECKNDIIVRKSVFFNSEFVLKYLKPSSFRNT